MDTKSLSETPDERVTSIVTDFVTASFLNTLGLPGGEVACDHPLVGFSSGDDPIYLEFKNHIGDFYWTPREIFERTFMRVRARAKHLTVISWILPQTRATKDENAAQKVYPSPRWAAARDSGENFNVALREHLVETLLNAGVQAVAPMLSPHWSKQASKDYGFASNWSERHAAYAAGLGTFGLCDGLITPVGKAIRAGSVVARLSVPSTSRPYQDHRAYCLYFRNGTCRKCVQLCPVAAISSQGHDKVRCFGHLEKARNYAQREYGIKTGGCGLCQVGVPCESHIPSPEEG
jgi:epoxyqueuosine reductase QueG